MARNGSGTYNLPAGNPVVTGTTISSTTTNNTFNDIATALTGSLSADGQTTPTGNLPMGGYKHTNVADATVRAQYASAGQVQDSAFTFLTSPAGTNTITATAALGMSAYVTGQRFFFVAAATNTGACTLNINAIGVKSVTKNGTTALVAGDIVSGAVVQVVYDGTQFQLLNPAGVLSIAGGGTNNGSLAVTAGGTLYTDGSKIVNVGAGTSGQVLTSAGASAPTWSTLTGSLNNIQYFTTVGTATYTPTSGTTFVVVQVVGGGGAGGTSTTVGGGGGGAGGYAIKKITSAFSGVTVTVGGATATSSFGALVSATGGSNASGATGGAAGTGASGDLNLAGGRGASAGNSNAPGGAGGVTIFGGMGASPIYSSASAGFAGAANTGAGGGGGSTNGSSGAAGGAGGSGLVIVYEYK